MRIMLKSASPKRTRLKILKQIKPTKIDNSNRANRTQKRSLTAATLFQGNPTEFVDDAIQDTLIFVSKASE